MKTAVLYIHGKGGSAAESEHYKPLFSECDVIGLDYNLLASSETEQAEIEIKAAVKCLQSDYEKIILIANSIGAFISMNADIEDMVDTAYFISPIADMERLIIDMMKWENVSEDELKEKGIIETSFGETLSWEYLCHVRKQPIKWRVDTYIIYGSNDNLTSIDTITEFASRHGASLNVMENGEHWFHTEEQMRFIDDVITKSRR